jgi:hypothetical protein
MGEPRPSILAALVCGSDVRPIVHYLEDTWALLSGAAARLRPHLDQAWRSAVAVAAAFSTYLAGSVRTAGAAGARLGAYPGRGRRRRAAAGRRQTSRPVERPAPVAGASLDPGRQWEIVMGIAAREVARASTIAALQARAELKIDAAEHALRRILADCAPVLPTRGAPATRPEDAPARPLAA